MKISECLIEIKDLTTRLSSLQSKLLSNLFVQEGSEPLVNTADLFLEIEKCSESLFNLKRKLVKINAETIIETPMGRMSIAEAIVIRDLIKNSTKFLNLLESSSVQKSRNSSRELRDIFIGDKDAYEKANNNASKIYRQIDTIIQSTNWTVDIPDNILGDITESGE